MSHVDKGDLIAVNDPLFEKQMPIFRYPVALYEGQEILCAGKRVAVVKETCVFHRREHLITYIEAQTLPAEIDHKADIRVEVAPDGRVYMGFFAKDDSMAMLDMESVARDRMQHGDYRNGLPLLAWVRDRQRSVEKDLTPAAVDAKK